MLNINELTRLYLGCQGENQQQTIQIDVNPWLNEFPNGTITIWHKRNGDTVPQPMAGVVLDREKGILSITPTNTDTYVAGEGEAEVRLTQSNVVKKTREVITGVSPAVTGSGQPLGSGWQDYIDAIERAAQVAILKDGLIKFEIDDNGHLIFSYTEDVPVEEEDDALTGPMSNPVWKSKDLGPVDAYAEAVAAGYTGTIEEWLLEVGSVKENAQAAAGSAAAAAGSATDANTAKAAAQAAQAACETEVTRQLSEIISNPDSPPLDRTLSSNVSAAPADMVGDLKSAFEQSLPTVTKALTSNEAIPFEPGAVNLVSEGSTLSNFNRVSPNSYFSAVCPCTAGDIFTITLAGAGGSGKTGAVAYSFVDSSMKVLKSSSINKNYSETNIQAPTNAAYAIFNTKNTITNYCAYRRTVDSKNGIITLNAFSAVAKDNGKDRHVFRMGWLDFVNGFPLPHHSNANNDRRACTPADIPFKIEAGSIIQIDDSSLQMQYVYDNSGTWISSNFFTGADVIRNTAKYFILIKQATETNAISLNDLIGKVRIYTKEYLQNQQTIIRNGILNPYSKINNGIYRPNLSIGNYDTVAGYPYPVISTANAGKVISTPIDFPVLLHSGDIITANDKNLNIRYSHYDNGTWTNSGWITGEKRTEITDTGLYYLAVMRGDSGNISFDDIRTLMIITKEHDSLKDNALDMLPNYYFEVETGETENWLQRRIGAVKANSNYVAGVNFAFITDTHFRDNMKNSRYMLKEICDKANVNYIIFGGDAIAVLGTEAMMYEQAETLMEYQKYLGVDKFFTIRGNHDCYNRPTQQSDDTKLAIGETYDALFRSCEKYTVDMVPSRMYYAVECKAQNTVFIMLNSWQGNSQSDVGYVSGKQAKWLADELVKYKDWYIIVFSHIATDPALPYYSANQAIFNTLLYAFNNHGSYNNTYDGTAINVNYSDASGKVVCYISGHSHRDRSNVYKEQEEGIGVLSIVTTCDAYYSDDTDEEPEVTATEGTVTEQAFDVFSVNYNDKTIKTVRFGRGRSMERTWSNII